MLFKNLPLTELIIVLLKRIILDLVISFNYLFKVKFINFLMVFFAYFSFIFLIPKYLFLNKKKAEKRKPIYQKIDGKYNINIIFLFLLKKRKFSQLSKK